MATICALFYSTLASNTFCPFCYHTNNPLGGPRGVTGTPDPFNQAQYTPVIPGTVTALRQIITNNNAYRAVKAAASSITTLGIL